MSFVFYDTETTGLATHYDQILQFAAIRTDADLNETGRIEVRSRLQSHLVPHPAALRVTGMTIDQITDQNLPSHYETVRQVRETLLGWSPAIFVGYNSLNFDEHLLRQALFQTLHPAYLTNTDGNCRSDAMPLVQAASVFAPDCLKVPVIAGKQVFRLDKIAALNNFSHERAHDALADVEATIHLAKCVREHAPECWNCWRSLKTDQLCSLKIDQGKEAEGRPLGCG
jgi:exodeoxyribonuclease-1